MNFTDAMALNPRNNVRHPKDAMIVSWEDEDSQILTSVVTQPEGAYVVINYSSNA